MDLGNCVLGAAFGAEAIREWPDIHLENWLENHRHVVLPGGREVHRRELHDELVASRIHQHCGAGQDGQDRPP